MTKTPQKCPKSAARKNPRLKLIMINMTSADTSIDRVDHIPLRAATDRRANLSFVMELWFLQPLPPLCREAVSDEEEEEDAE